MIEKVLKCVIMANSYKQLTAEEKSRIVTLAEEGYSKREIARLIGCSDFTVRNVLNNFEETGSVHRKKGSGRPRATTTLEDNHLKRICLKNRFLPATQLQRELAEIQIQKNKRPCSVKTVQRRLKEMGLVSMRPAKKPLLTKKMKEKRLQWCRNHENWTFDDWKRVIFSDESKFNLYGPDGTLRVRRRKGERYNEDCVLPTVKHSEYVMVWGAITAYGVGQIIIIREVVNAEKYKQIINEGVLPTIEGLTENISHPIFQDDSAPCHRARLIQNYKRELGINSLAWPGNSPDLNPIENIWAIMGKKIKEMKPTNVGALEKIILDVWNNCVTTELINNLYLSMPVRVKEVIRVKGGPTKY